MEDKIYNEEFNEAAKAAESAIKTTGVSNKAALIGIGAIGALAISKLLNMGFEAIKKHKAKKAEGEPNVSDRKLGEDYDIDQPIGEVPDSEE